MLIQIILITTLGSVVSLFGGFLLLLRKNWNMAFSLLLTSFAAGVLLATAFLDLFPESMEHLKEVGGGDVFVPALVGIVCFFLLERTLLWFHHHHGSHGIKPTVWMITLGDGVHNFIDGVAIAATFILNPSIGVMTALAVAAHEIPQEIADFSVLLSRGLSKQKAIIFNVASALTALVGAIGMYLFSEILEMHLGFITAFAAGMFVYIALSDLIPELHHSENKKETIPQIAAFLVGIMLVFLLKTIIGEAAHGV
ncbi:TPA: ZIP zinc transporter [Patescibacteria group bacterium]|uniref:Zinc/iron permease n=1 Tax=Candidatus Gottesmanbacteria bacterium GW2011_GWA1_43_11 TaxID=1618436 RepID=A0A0G1FF45_9BACT|nr:MAG: Zinc/iron permease [Candidatus Gottesmanbacteria bacterium GW2011_GWA1_43_11]HCS78849.1 ZIP zinc transporter [Patescibacteria group bacterium]